MNFDLQKIFLNKICTIFVRNINRNFNEEQNIDYFVGKVLQINEDGILIEHVASKSKSFYFLNSIIGIAEESYVSYSNDEKSLKKSNEVFAEVKEEIKKNENVYDSIDNLTNFINK